MVLPSVIIPTMYVGKVHQSNRRVKMDKDTLYRIGKYGKHIIYTSNGIVHVWDKPMPKPWYEKYEIEIAIGILVAVCTLIVVFSL